MTYCSCNGGFCPPSVTDRNRSPLYDCNITLVYFTFSLCKSFFFREITHISVSSYVSSSKPSIFDPAFIHNLRGAAYYGRIYLNLYLKSHTFLCRFCTSRHILDLLGIRTKSVIDQI